MQDSGADVQGAVAFSSAELQKQIASIAQPALRATITKLLTDLGEPGMEPASVRKEYGAARDKVNADFDTAQKVSAAGIKQDILQSGARFSRGATNEAIARSSDRIERSRGATVNALTFEEASAGLNQTNYLLSALLGAGNSAISGALGYGQNAAGAGSILSQINASNRQQGSTIGSFAGTILGALLAPYTGGASIPIGAGVGGAVGGYIGGG